MGHFKAIEVVYQLFKYIDPICLAHEGTTTLGLDLIGSVNEASLLKQSEHLGAQKHL